MPTTANAGPVCSACGRPLPSDEGRVRRLFLYGIALAWLPLLPMIVGLANAFRGISNEKATGVGAVAGGFAEIGMIYFLLLAPICVVAAFICLARSLSHLHSLRKVFAIISLGWTIIVAGLFAISAVVLVFYSRM